ncbi:MAG: tetratricopeptide repeat protein [Lysobacterales bacterium]
MAFRINDLHVDPTIGLVTGPEGSVHLEPRVLAVLQALARQAGTLVSRRDLLSGIWPGADTYDEALTQCVYQLRQQLVNVGGPDCRNLISTVPKRGYLLNAEVHPVAPEVVDVGASRAHGRGRQILVGMVAVALLLGGVWAIFAWRAATDTAAALPHADTVAVLPFLPLVEESRDPVLELGMADTLIARLSGIRQIVVRPISSVRRYADMDRDTLQAGRELGADAVVEGSIQRSGQGLRVTVRLLRVGDGAALWADTFHESSASMFEVQDAICERIAAALAREFGQQVQPQPARLGTSDAEAYEDYLKGRYDLARFTLRDMRASIDHFRRAVSRDPNYAQAWLGLANVQFRIPIAGEAPPREYYPNAKAAAQRALEIDPTLAEGHAMLGWIAHWYDWDWAASEAHFKRAIELDPRDTEGLLGYAHLLSVTGRHEQALAEVRRTREISPYYPVAASLEGFFLLRAQRPEEAIQRLEDARQLNENFWLIRLHLTEAYVAAGRYEDALKEARAARQISGGSTIAMAREVACLAKLGRAAEAEALLSELLQRAAERYVPPFHLAAAYDGVGDADAALASLERAYEVRDPKMVLLGVGGWDSVRDRPEFVDLMHRMDLVESVP